MDEQVAIDFYARKVPQVISEAVSEKRSVTNICDTMDLDQISQS